MDGELKTEIDTYLSPGRAATAPYNIIGLAAGQHILTIEATGIHNQSAKGSWVWIDGFRYRAVTHPGEEHSYV